MISGLGIVASALLAYALIPRPSPPVKVTKHTLISDQTGRINKISALAGYVVEADAEFVTFDDSEEQKELEVARDNLQKVADELRASGVAIALPTFPDRLGGRIIQTGTFTPTSSDPPKKIEPLPEINGTSSESSSSTPKATAPKPPVDPAKFDLAIASANESIEECRRAMTDRELAIQETERAVATSKAIYDQAKADADRTKMLLNNGAVSANESSRKDNLAFSQKSIWDNNQARLTEEKAALESTRSNLRAFEKEIEDAKEAKAKAIANAPEPKPRALAPTPVPAKNQHFSRPAYVVSRPVSASTEPTKVIVDRNAKTEADEKLKKAKVALDDAEAAILARNFLAPRRLRVIKWLVTPGSTVKEGQPICEVEFLPAATKLPVAPQPEPALPEREPEPAIKGQLGRKPNIEESEKSRKIGK